MMIMATTGNNLLRILMFLATLLALSSSQYFSVEPQDTETVEGNQVVMTCRVNSRPDGAKLYWQIPAVSNRFVGPEYSVPAEYADRYQVIGDPQLEDYNLVINSATEADEGFYKCILYLTQNGGGDPIEVAASPEAQLTVAVLDPSGAPDCWASPRRELYEGSPVNLHCASSASNINLEWMQGTTVLSSFPNTSTSIPTLITTSLVTDPTMNDETFTCEATNRDDMQCQVVLSVLSPPVVVIEAVGEAKSGDDGRYRCTATGNPSVFSYSWKYNDQGIGFQYDRRFNMALLEDGGEVLLLPDVSTSDDAAILECTAINEVGEGSNTYSVRVEINNTTTIVAWCLCAVVVAIIVLLLVGFFYWRSQQRRKMEKITMQGKNAKPGPIDNEMNGHVNPAFTSFSPLDVDSVGYGPDMQPYQSRPSDREYDRGGPNPIPRQNSEARSKTGDEDVDEEEVTQTYTYQVNPNFEEYRTKASYDVSQVEDEVDDDGAYGDDLKKPLSQNDLDLEKELVGELSMFSNYDPNFDNDTEPVIVSTEL